MNQDQLLEEMSKAARVIIHAKQSSNATLVPSRLTHIPPHRITQLKKSRDACGLCAIMFLLVFIAGTGGPLEEIWGFLPTMLCLTLFFLTVGAALDRKVAVTERTQNSGG